MFIWAISSRLGRSFGVCFLTIAFAVTAANAQVVRLVKDLSGETIANNPNVVGIDDAGSSV